MVFSPMVDSFVCVALSAAAARSSSSCGLRFFPAKRFVMYVADGGVVVSLAPLAVQCSARDRRSRRLLLLFMFS